MDLPAWFEPRLSALDLAVGQGPEAVASALRDIRVGLLQEDVPLTAIKRWKEAVLAAPNAVRVATTVALGEQWVP